MKCCVCQRIKTDRGWDYQFVPIDENTIVSHGYCPVCYRKALTEIDATTPAEALQAAR